MEEMPFEIAEEEKLCVVEKEECSRCHRMVPSASLSRHQQFCLNPYKDKVSAMLRGEGILTLMEKLCGEEVTLDGVYNNFDSLVGKGCGTYVPFEPPAALPPPIIERMLQRAEEGGCRLADRQGKHHTQEVAMCAAIAELLRLHHPDVWVKCERGADITDDVCLIDVGAACGELLHLFQEIAKTTIVLVEFYRPPRMVDHYYEGNPNFARIWKKLEEVGEDDLRPFARRVNIVVAKHLCGDGSDAAMRHVVEQWSDVLSTSHVIIAPCCQQMSTWEGYCGRPYLLSRRITEEDFSLLQKKTGWKSLKHKTSLGRHRALHDVACMLEALWLQGRVEYLRARGGEAIRMYQFIEEEVTLKNIIISAMFGAQRSP